VTDSEAPVLCCEDVETC